MSQSSSTTAPAPVERSSNRSAVLNAPRELSIDDRPVPAPGPREVLVEVGAVGICGSDVHYFEHGRIGEFVVTEPMVIGHEAAGTVVDVGAEVDRDRIGQRVALEPGVPCRHCAQCLAGRYNLCPDITFYATPPYDGAIAEVVTLDAAFAHPVPEGMSDEQAAMAEPVSVGLWACRKADLRAGERVLVTGAGPIGLLAGQVARAFGATGVTITDVSDFRLGVARQLGLDARRAGERLDGEYEVLLECSGAAAAVRSGLRALARGRAGGTGRDGPGRGPDGGAHDPDPRTERDRHVPLCQHLAVRPAADRVGRGGRRRPDHPPLRTGPDRGRPDAGPPRPGVVEGDRPSAGVSRGARHHRIPASACTHHCQAWVRVSIRSRWSPSKRWSSAGSPSRRAAATKVSD